MAANARHWAAGRRRAAALARRRARDVGPGRVGLRGLPAALMPDSDARTWTILGGLSVQKILWNYLHQVFRTVMPLNVALFGDNCLGQKNVAGSYQFRMAA